MKFLGMILLFFTFAGTAEARWKFGPYYSLKSTKSIETNREDKSQEDSVNKTREEYGIRSSLALGRWFKIELQAGQSNLEVEEKTRDAKDEFDEIDYVEDANLDMSNGDVDVVTLDEITNVRAGLMFDPSFSIFVARTKLGVQARKRKLTITQQLDPNGDNESQVFDEPITYKPYAGVGLGVKFSRNFFWIIEYQGYFYKFPELEPFQREVTVSFAINFGK